MPPVDPTVPPANADDVGKIVGETSAVLSKSVLDAAHLAASLAKSVADVEGSVMKQLPPVLAAELAQFAQQAPAAAIVFADALARFFNLGMSSAREVAGAAKGKGACGCTEAKGGCCPTVPAVPIIVTRAIPVGKPLELNLLLRNQGPIAIPFTSVRIPLLPSEGHLSSTAGAHLRFEWAPPVLEPSSTALVRVVVFIPAGAPTTTYHAALQGPGGVFALLRIPTMVE